MTLLAESSLGDVYAARVVVLPSRAHEMVLAVAHLLNTRSAWDAMADGVWDALQAEVSQALSALMDYGSDDVGEIVEIAQYRHKTASGVSGGASVAATRNVRPLTEAIVQPAWATVNGNVVEVSAGKYLITVEQSAYKTGHSRTEIHYENDVEAAYFEGPWVYVSATDNMEVVSCCTLVHEFAFSTTIEVFLYTSLAQAANGLGVGTVLTKNVFALLTIERLGDPTP